MTFEDGSSSNNLVKVPNQRLEEWDNEHDAAGKSLVHGVVVNPKHEIESSAAVV